MEDKFGEWLEKDRLNEGRSNPLRKLRDIEEDTTTLLVCCDWLQDKGFEDQKLDLKNLAYIKPISSNLSKILAKRFPHLEILRRGGGLMPARIYYTLFNIDLLLEACKFLHISSTQHVIDAPRIEATDFVSKLSAERLQEIATSVYKSHPELFKGPLTGRGALPRAKAKLGGVSTHYQYWALKKALPGEDMRSGTVYNRQGLLAVMQAVANEINTQWGVDLKPEELIEPA